MADEEETVIHEPLSKHDQLPTERKNEKGIVISEEEEPFRSVTWSTSTETADKTTEKTEQNGRIKWAIYVLCGITILHLVGLLTITSIWHVNRVKKLVPREHEICLNCSELTDKPKDSGVLGAFAMRDGRCCGTTSQILNQLVEKNTKEKYAKDLSNNFFAYAKEGCRTKQEIPEKAAAKVAGISFTESAQDTSPLNIVHFNRSNNDSFIKTGVDYKQGRFIIETPGFYYIFNQLKWAINDTDLDPLVHEVNMLAYRQGDHEVLLQGTKSKCNMLEETGESTSSIGAVFELNKDDTIFVTTSRPGSLVPCCHGNFFGLYLVAEK